MKRFATALMVAGILAGPAAGAGAASPAGDVAACTWTHDLRLSPGLTMTPASARWSHAEPESVIRCVGTVGGHAVTGTGTITAQGSVAGTCAQGRGDGHQTVVLPTTAGPVRIEQSITIGYAGLAGTFSGPRLGGTFEFVPTIGTCLTGPLGGALILAQGVITS
jgi:hypothetical protein